MSISDAAQVFAAFATLVVAGVTCWGLKQQANQFQQSAKDERERARAAQEPRLWPVGCTFRLYNQETHRGYFPPDALRIENLGRGAAFAVQWQIGINTEFPGYYLVVQRETTYAQRALPNGDLTPLWRKGASVSPDIDVADAMRLAMWYDDSLGNHYYSEFEVHGDQGNTWTEIEFRSITKRPEPVLPPSVI